MILAILIFGRLNGRDLIRNRTLVSKKNMLAEELRTEEMNKWM
jgi:hypothetical protein